MEKLLKKMNATWVLVLPLLLYYNYGQAQQSRTVQGIVINELTKESLSDVNVSVVGGTTTVRTAKDGSFSIQAATTSKLQLSYVGFETTIVNAAVDNLHIGLRPSDRSLDEVVVVAYGTAKRANFTGSVSTISAENINNRPVSSVSKALEGQVPGLQSVSSSGQPGTDATIRIRGIGSINASSAPLYVVDGNPYNGDINAINQSDIQSISVLKDAAASALYGSRGANGVIIITTKNGAKGDTRINFSLNQGFSNRAVKDYEKVNTDQYFELYWEALRNRNVANKMSAEQAAATASRQLVTNLGINPYGSGFPEPVGVDGKLVTGAKTLWNDNWEDVLLRTGNRTQSDLNFGGGGEKSDYYLSFGYLNDQGVAIESGFKRYNARLNTNVKAKSWLNAGLNLSVSSSLQKYPTSEDSNTANIINFPRTIGPFYPYYKRESDGSYELDDNDNKIYDFGSYRPAGATPNSNMAASLPLDKNDIRRENLSGRAYLEAILTSDLKFRTTYSLDYVNSNTHDFVNPLLGDGVRTKGSVSKSNFRRVSYTLNNILTYDKTWDDHHINLLGGQEFYKYQNSEISGSRERFVMPGFNEPDAASLLTGFDGYSVDYALLSFLGRAEYDYKNRYFFSGSLRTDGSSRFAPDTRWGTFWSLGASWKIAEEEFLKNTGLFNQLTLRASYGAQGNDNLGTYYAYQGLYAITNSLGEGGTVTRRLATPDLKWETNLNLNVGLDVAILNNRISASIEYFDRKSKDLLYTMPMAPSTGFTGYDVNLGGIKNTGIELTLQTIPIRNEDFRWNLDLNVSHFKNQITELPNGNKDIESGNKLLRVGGSIYDFYIKEWAGVNPGDGTPTWYIQNADGSKDATWDYSKASRSIQGSALPKVTGGLSNTFTYKNIDLSALLTFSLGGKIYDGDYLMVMHNGNSPGRAWSKEILNRWTPENTDTDVPALSTTNSGWTQQSTRFLYSASYARLKNVSLGYNFSKNLLTRIGLQQLRVFAQGENLLTFNKHKGMDPEQTVNGATYYRYPAMRSVSAGLQLGF
ncbi:SusC/RagA family TonB-linked outer membrane protein [Sphingobacterium sp. SYP-B4668]|uniref:SusC/RagA family TonB-linked outer membrane protein n=1 Tax=Sphingobacterium sp. SYP-B4668 TaxID=2996035 RepID=UPI0022DDBEA9|nr:TonB-dependent receptor [Sphingobacterium sp. SYP-B4668]